MRRFFVLCPLFLMLMLMAAPASAQIPIPTPTLLPVGNLELMPDVNITEDDISLWKVAPNAVQIWNMSNRDNVMTFYQVGALFLICGVGIMFIYRTVTKVATDV